MKSKTFLIGLVLIVAVYGCIQPSEEDIARAIEETRVAEQTSTPRVTNTPIDTEVQCQIEEEQHEEWETVLCETFDNNLYGWQTGTDIDMGVETSIKNGKYIIDYTSRNETGYKTGWVNALQFGESKDYVVSIRGEIQSVYRDCTWGILVRGNLDDGYAFSIDNQGNYFLTDPNLPGQLYIGNGKYGSNSAIKWDQPNTITAVVEGEDMTFYVNGTPIMFYEAGDASRKEISRILWGSEGVTVIYEFDDILVREKKSNNSING